MLLNKNNLAIYDIASKSEIKRAIAGVYITPEETVATDSFMLVAVTTPKADAGDYPVQEGRNTKHKEVRTIITSAMAKAVLKKMPKAHKTLPILDNAIVTNFKGERRITITSTDLEVWEETTSDVIDEEFPKYKDLIPKGKPKVCITINYKLLEKAIKALARTADKTNAIKIELFDNDKPMKITSDNREQKTTALVMPFRK